MSDRIALPFVSARVVQRSIASERVMLPVHHGSRTHVSRRAMSAADQPARLVLPVSYHARANVSGSMSAAYAGVHDFANSVPTDDPAAVSAPYDAMHDFAVSMPADGLRAVSDSIRPYVPRRSMSTAHSAMHGLATVSADDSLWVSDAGTHVSCCFLPAIDRSGMPDADTHLSRRGLSAVGC